MPHAGSETSAAHRVPNIAQKSRKIRFANTFEREIFLVICGGIALLHWIALGSYSPLDPSFTTTVLPETSTTNLAGVFGSYIASTTFFCIGLSTWLLPIPLIITAVSVYKKSESALTPTRHVGWIIFLACSCIATTMFVPWINIDGFDLPSGGLVGSSLAIFFKRTLGVAGEKIALGTISLMSLLWIVRRPLITPFSDFIKQKLKTLSSAIQRIRFFNPLSKATKIRNTSSDSGLKVKRRSEGDTPPLLQRDPLIADQIWDPNYRVGSTIPTIPNEGITNIVPIQSQGSANPFSMENHVESTIAEAPRNDVAPSYTPPPLSVFHQAPNIHHHMSPHELESTSVLLVKTFEDFGVSGQIIGYQPGPVVTVYEFQPDAGVKQSKVTSLIDDLALALKVDSIFIYPVRGKRALGVQVPNSKREPVFLGDILNTSSFRDATSPLTFGLGKTITGQPLCTDLTTMPHLLVAGATGSGKSVGINAMLCSIIMKATPEQVRMILVDPKMLELSVYEGIPHLLMPVITEPSKASLALKWAANEMERRYRLMQLASVRNIDGFNDFWSKVSSDRRLQIRDAMDDQSLDKLPYILLVIDELADLMMTAPKDVEGQIQRLAQKARASGIHMVLATQRPSVDIITGVIKANLPCRIAYQVVSKHDSRTILDVIGAEKLLGKGDLIFQRPGVGRLERLQGALISDEEVLNLVASVKASSTVQYDEKIINWIDEEFDRQKDGQNHGPSECDSPDDEPKFNEAISIARAHGVVSASFLQRHLKIGYNRAARIVEFMESKGLIDKADGAKPRKWLGN